MEKIKWFERLFGKTLIKCESSNKTNDFELVQTEDVVKQASIVGIYFSFANINIQSDEFIKKLRDLYDRLRNESGGDDKKLEVIQVVMWAHNDNYGDFEASHKESLTGLPWFGMPFSEIDLKTRLSKRYRIKSGVPTLVLLDRDGKTVCISAQDRLIEDPVGAHFPWRPRPIDQVLKDVVLQPGGAFFSEHKTHRKEDIRYGDLPEGVRGFYFSANWCPPCRAFTPQLAEAYRVIRKKEPEFEVIFVSSDRSSESFGVYVEAMPWLAVPFEQSCVRAELAQLYGVRGIPTLLLLDRNGHVITMDARTQLMEDPMAQNFPWKPRAVNILTERFLTKLHDYPAVVLFVERDDVEVQFAESVLSPASDSYYKARNINFDSMFEDSILNYEEENHLQFLVAADSEPSDILRDLIGLDEVMPLLVAVDLPNRKSAIMEYGVEITVSSVGEFVEKLQRNELKFNAIEDRDEPGES